jgi:hypothetical protein
MRRDEQQPAYNAMHYKPGECEEYNAAAGYIVGVFLKKTAQYNQLEALKQQGQLFQKKLGLT